ncbi:MAG: hypothetical protein F4045_04395 [Chloroflexi bacterium]|nr:hypothetical protein [Chloroflexota bacterium]MYK34351.1 hypothetical protein [Chloroflexota bacterium]
MAEQVFVMRGDTLEPVDEQPFELEDDLQELLAKHPRLLGNARSWLLVTREKGVADAPDGADRWSLDHLFVDQDAVPTLVEVKRGRNSQIRREVVGQMLDYAANGSQFWTQDEIREAFEREHESSSELADAVLQDFLGEEYSTDDEFWTRVATNLAARRMRLVFVADTIPPELIRIVEFLNAQMRDIEVLAVEIKQFKGNDQTETLVSRVIGHTATLPTKNASSRARRAMTMDEFYERLPDDGIRNAAKRLVEVATDHEARVFRGPASISIRVGVHADQMKEVSVAWFNPIPDVAGGLSLKNFSFGMPIHFEHGERLGGVLEDWLNQFAHDGFGEDVQHGNSTKARTLTFRQVVEHQDILAERLANVIDDLRGL